MRDTRFVSSRAGAMNVTLLAWARESGGAERQLVNLACGLRRRGHDVLVVVFFPNAYVEVPLRESDTPFRVLHVRGRWDAARYLLRFLAHTRERNQDIVYGFLQVPNLLTLSLKALRPDVKVVWGIRTSDSRSQPGLLAHVATRLETRLAPAADLLIANSRHGRDDAVSLGIAESTIEVIDNGIDVELFRPDPQGGARTRSGWGIADDRRVIGLIGRLEAKKDHDTFLRAAAIAARERPDLSFACVGDGTPAARARLEAEARARGLGPRFVCSAFRPDMPAVYSAIDVATLTSAYGEGFPNAIAEAMACGRACVATDVGDARRIVGELGWIVPPRDPEALADAWLRAVAQAPDHELGLRRRRRIEESFSLERMIERTEQALSSLLRGGSRG